jgi:tripeptide aminopeptidase
MKTALQQLNQNILWDTFLDDLSAWTLDEGIRIQQIPAPTFAERPRAEYVAEQFRVFGLQHIEIDSLHNVYGVMRGTKSGGGLMLMAHTDTVFPAETDLTVQYNREDIVLGPGLGDNSLGVSGMLAVLKYLVDSQTTPACDIWFVATSCEEGLGDLRGVRQAYKTLEKHVGVVINLEGMALGHVYHAGISVHRLKITVTTEGGHSWLHFGRASAIHSLMQLGAKISAIQLPPTPRTTYNIGVIEGGQSINSIATSATMWLDLRSEQQSELEKIKQQVLAILKEVPNDVTLTIEVVGDRPAGYLNPRHVLVQGALQALSEVNITGTLETGSTDGNIPLYYGCPCVTVGITRGGNAHRTDEFIEIAPIQQGIRQLILLTLATCQHHAQNKLGGNA